MNESETKPGTVLGHPERVFRDAWLAIQWKAMARTGKGYRRPPQPTAAQARIDAAREKQAAERQTREASAPWSERTVQLGAK